MPDTTIDVEAFSRGPGCQIARKRAGVGTLARHLGISPSTLTRMAQGKRPDVDTLRDSAALAGDACRRFHATDHKEEKEANAVAMISSYLRADRNIDPKDAEALEDIVKAAYRRLTERR